MRTLGMLMLLAMALPSYAGSGPKSVADSFYARALSRQNASLPFTPAELARLSHILSPQFIALAAQASKLQNSCVGLTPTDLKPLILEHSLFIGSDGDANRFSYAKWHREENLARVDVDLTRTYTWDKQSHIEKWRDTLVLELVRGRWLVRDVLFEGSSSSIAMLERYLRDAAVCALRD